VKNSEILADEVSMKCPKCAGTIKSGWKICPFCAAEIEEKKKCASCGSEMEEGWVACPYCKTPALTKQTPGPKYNLRREPTSVSDDDAKKIFRLSDQNRPLEHIANEYKDNGNGTVTDAATGLMWQKSGSDQVMWYLETLDYIDRLNRNRFAGHTDWRMPTVEELVSLLEPEVQSDDLFIHPVFDGKQGWCWSADKRSVGSAWFVHFYYSGVLWTFLGDGVDVRAVRSL